MDEGRQSCGYTATTPDSPDSPVLATTGLQHDISLLAEQDLEYYPSHMQALCSGDSSWGIKNGPL